MNDDEYKKLVEWVKDHSKFYNMKSVCEFCGFSYTRFTNWKAERLRLKTSELKKLKDAMKSVSND